MGEWHEYSYRNFKNRTHYHWYWGAGAVDGEFHLEIEEYASLKQDYEEVFTNLN